MKRRNTYYVSFIYSYNYFDTNENSWLKSTDFDSKIVTGILKKDIHKSIKKEVLEELKNDNIQNFKFRILELYLTTDDACI